MSTTIQKIDTEEIIKDYHSDLLAFLKAHFSSASRDDSVATDGAGFMMTRIRVILDQHIGDLEAAGEKRFGDPDLGHRIKETLAKATGWTFGMLSGMGSHGTSKTMRDEYMFLNATSIGYSLLYTTEVGANGHSPYSDVLLEHLNAWNRLIVAFNRSLPATVLRELTNEEEGFDRSRAIDITKRLQSTWSAEPEGQASASN